VRQLASPGSVEEFGQVVVCRSIPIIVFDVAAHASDAPLCWTSTRCARLWKARGPPTLCPLIPRLIDATAYVAKAAREACLRSIVNMSQVSNRREWERHQARDDWISERVFSFRNAMRMSQRIDAVRLSSFRQLPSRRIALAQ
jgi:hypothetical protein